MIDITPLKDFLSGIAPISGIDYQIWDTNGKMQFSTVSNMSKTPSVQELQNLSNRIIYHKRFRYNAGNGSDFLCGIPIKNGQGVSGALVAFGRHPHKSSPDQARQGTLDIHAIKMENFLSSLTALVEDNLNAYEEVEEMAQELEKNFEDLYLYGQIASQIKTVKFTSENLEILIRKLQDNMRVDMVFSNLPNWSEYNLWLSKPQTFEKIPSPKTFLEKLIRLIPPDASSLEDNYFIVNDSRKHAHYKDLSKHPYRFLAVQVEHHEEFYGWLGLVSFNLNEIFRQGELKLLISMAEQLAGAITNTDLYNDLEQFIINMVRSLVFAIEAKDIYTRGHSERVSKYSMLMGKRLGLNEKEFKDLKWASILHDIGKIGIPESILNKPDRLTDAEFEIIKEHSEKGGEILFPVEQLKDSLPGIIHHHERYDGKGYPRGLKGEEIPLTARIIAVADTFDAINSNRAYRSARSAEKAMTIIEDAAGTQLDARVVKVFKKVYKEDIIREDKGSS